MDDMLREYFPILVFLGLAGGVACLMVFGSMLLVRRRPDPHKLAAYECGFDAFGDARARFDVRFYLVTLLFIIFDLEVAFLFPWAVSLGETQWVGWIGMMVFLGILAIGLAYEWKKGALDWE